MSPMTRISLCLLLLAVSAHADDCAVHHQPADDVHYLQPGQLQLPTTFGIAIKRDLLLGNNDDSDVTIGAVTVDTQTNAASFNGQALTTSNCNQ